MEQPQLWTDWTTLGLSWFPDMSTCTLTINGVGHRVHFCMNFRLFMDSAGQSAGQLTGQDITFFHKFWMNHWWHNRNCEQTGPCYRTPVIPGHYVGTPTIKGIVQRLFCSTWQSTGQSTGQWDSTGQLAGHDLVFFGNSSPHHMVVLLWFLNMILARPHDKRIPRRLSCARGLVLASSGSTRPL